jgi:lipopolysaccharide transport protein LptA
VVVTKGSIVMRGAVLEVRQDAAGNQFGVLKGEPGKRAFFRQKRDTPPGAVDEFMEGEAETIEYDGRADTVRFLQRAELRRYLGTTLSDEMSGVVIVYDNTTSVLTVVEPLTPQILQPGQNPRAQLVMGPDGALYGTTVSGGASNQGAVFKVTTAGVVTTLANFYGFNGMAPNAGLILASDGHFYGTTTSGGANNLGTVFRMTPSGTLTTLAHLTTATGSAPRAPLIQALDGQFYGTTSANGTGNGTIFRMTSSGVITVLVNFSGTSGSFMGSSCQAGLIRASDGNLYGLTSTGGNGGGFGTVFRLTTSGAFTSLRSFIMCLLYSCLACSLRSSSFSSSSCRLCCPGRSSW